MLKSRGYLRAHDRLCRLAAIPFQLVSLCKNKIKVYLSVYIMIIIDYLGTVLLAIFISIYAQEDKSNFEPYCEANFMISPKNGIAILLIIEFITVTLFSLLYASELKIKHL